MCKPATRFLHTAPSEDSRLTSLATPAADRAAHFYQAAIGKKAVMAVTGLILFAYVLAHLLGNLQIYSSDPEQINRYAAFLHDPGRRYLLWAARLILLAAVGWHITASVQLWLLKREARPIGYFKKDDVPAAYAARTMIWSGPIILAFVIFHILHLTVGSVFPLRELGANQPDVRANVVGELIAGEVAGGACINFRQHGCVPCVPLRHDSVIDIFAALLQVGTLHRVLNDIEEKRVVEDLQILVVAVSRRSLRVRLVTPEQLAHDWRCVLREHRQ